MEVYGRQDELIFVEERITKMMNPNLGDRGYHNLIAVWWDAQEDYYGYTVHDAMQVKEWSQKDVDVFFSPDFMRRGWFPAPLKTQAKNSFYARTCTRTSFPRSETCRYRLPLRRVFAPKMRLGGLFLKKSMNSSRRV